MTVPTWSIDLRGVQLDAELRETVTTTILDVLRNAPAITDFIGTIVEQRAREVLRSRLVVRVEREDPMVALGGRETAMAIVWLGNPPIQSMSKTRQEQDRADAAHRAAVDELARSSEAAVQRSQGSQVRLENLEKARRAALQLGRVELDALARRLPWIASWEIESETLWIGETKAGCVTFENLLDLSTALATRDINVAGTVDHGWYPEDCTAEVRLEVRGDDLRAAVQALAASPAIEAP